MNRIDTVWLRSYAAEGAMGLAVGLALGLVCQHPALWSVVGVTLGLLGSKVIAAPDQAL